MTNKPSYAKHPLPKWWSLAIIVFIFFSPAFLQGCDGMLGSEDPSIIDMTTSPDEKFRHEALLDRAIKRNAGSKSGSDEIGLIIAIEPQRVLDRYKILDRYRILDRYKILDRYEYNEAFDGFAITVEDIAGLSEYNEFLDMLESDPDILWFEPDFNIETPLPTASSGETLQFIPWSVAAVGGKDSWTRSGDGQGEVDVDVFILDTGTTNDELNIVESLDFRDSQLAGDSEDYDGHGTHVAGIVGAEDDTDGLVGIAPGARIHNYKVLNDDGRTDVSVVIAAMEHIIGLKEASPSTPMVVNLSLGEDIGVESYTALDYAVQTASDAGVICIVAAGNQGINASKVTPAHARDAITVASYDVNGVFSPFSNFGPAVDILAPGEAIISLEPSTTAGKPVSMSGTSMAAPHVTGAVALYLAENPMATPQQVLDALLEQAKDFVVATPSQTTNKSVWVGHANTETLEMRISNSADDAEQATTNGVFYNQSPDLELADDIVNTSAGQMVGLRYNGLNIPQGATITNAYIQFTADIASSGTTNLVIKGENSDHAASFPYSSYSLTNRNLTDASVAWSPAAWTSAGESGLNQRTNDISTIIQEIVYRSGWSAGNSLALMITGSGDRSAVSHNSNPGQAPLLHVEWLSSGYTAVTTPTTGNGQSLSVAISNGNDDVEENPNRGHVYLGYDELYLGNGSSQWDSGLRFTGLNIPQGATITSASIQFTAYAPSSESTNLVIKGEQTDNAAAFSSSRNNLSSRSKTNASVPWSPDAWNSEGDAGPAQQTPDISAIVQEIVNRSGWQANNAMVLSISGTGWRALTAYEGNSNQAAVLNITWQ